MFSSFRLVCTNIAHRQQLQVRTGRDDDENERRVPRNRRLARQAPY
jgi:hypothetical protein